MKTENRKILVPVGIVALFLTTVVFTGCSSDTISPKTENSSKNEQTKDLTQASVHEIEMDSFTKIVDGKYFPQFSKKEITVKKGEKVRFKINTTSGTHDFKIDEFNVYSETPTGEITIIEFTPDKVGEFVYWCTKPRHRELGHWGTLIVTE